MNTQASQASVIIPLTAVRCLYRNDANTKVVCEIDVASLKGLNTSTTIDEMVAEAHLEYFAGKTKGFDDAKNLMAHLTH